MALKWAASMVDSWVEIEVPPDVAPGRVLDGWGAWRFPEASLGPGGGAAQAFLRWGLWFISGLGLLKIAVWIWLCVFLGVETQASLGLWYPVLFGVSCLAIIRTQPVHAAFLALVGASWWRQGTELAWFDALELFCAIAPILFLMLVIEWRAHDEGAPRVFYLLGLFVSGVIVPALCIAWPGTRELVTVAWWILLLALLAHTERCFRLGLRRTLRIFVILAGSSMFVSINVIRNSLPSIGEHATWLFSYCLITLVAIGCLLFEWAHRRRLRE